MAESTFKRDPRAASPSPQPEYDGRCRGGATGIAGGDQPRAAIRWRGGLRLAMRGLIVAGVAGTAWLLSSSAAQAAGDTTGAEPTGTTATTGTDRVTSLVNPLSLAGAGDPTELSSLLRSTARGGDDVVLATATDLVAEVLPEVTNALGPDRARGSADANGATATAGTTPATSGPLGIGLPALLNVDRPLGLTSRPAPSAGLGRKVGPRPPTGRLTNAHTADGVRGGSSPSRAATAVATGSGAAPAVTTEVGAASRVATARQRAAAHQHTPVPVVDRTGWHGTYHEPMLPRPAPAPASPVSGVSTGAPSTVAGPGHDCGGSALVPASQAPAPAVRHRTGRAVDVTLRRLFAEDPTVSPD